MATTVAATRHNGHAVRALREARRLTVSDLCAEMVMPDTGKPMSLSALRNIELEHRDCSPEALRLLARALDVDASAITRSSEDATRHNGHTIRAVRVASGLSVQDLCNALTSAGRPLSAPALRNIELEHRECKADLVERIATALDVDTRALVRLPLAEWGVKAA